MNDRFTIHAYSDSSRSKKIASFESMIDPVDLQFEKRNRFSQLFPINGIQPLTSFNSGGKESLLVQLLLDGSGANLQEGEEPVPVVKQINLLRKCTVAYHGSSHQPPFLEVIWTDMPTFWGRAEDLKLDYKVVNQKKAVMQVDVKLLLLEDIPVKLSQKQASKESPDLFHHHRVGLQESLPMISYLYYKSTRFVQHIARANQLKNLYDCKPGTILLIPPIDESWN